MPRRPQVVQVVRDPRRSNAPICTAHWPDGNPCKLIAEGGTTKCRRHGGKSLKGVAAPGFKHGRYSSALPTRLAARYEEARSNPRLLSVGDDLAVLEARLAELLAQSQTGGGAALWGELQETWRAFGAARQSGDLAAMEARFQALEGLVGRGRDEAAVWAEIQSLWETRAKLTQTEVKTLQGLQQLLTVHEHMLMLQALTHGVMEAVKRHAAVGVARKILMDVEAEFTRLATLGEGR